MSLGMNHSEVPPTRFMGMRLTEAVLGTELPIMIGQDRASWKLLWYGAFSSKQAQSQSSGGSGLGKSGSPNYVYSASVIGSVCMGPCNALLGVWGGTSSGGKYAVDTVTETYTIPSSGSTTYQVNQNAIYAADAGVSFEQPYSYDVNDYSSQGSVTLSGNTNVSLQATTTNPPGVNQYYVNPATGQYTFNPANSASSVTAGSAVSAVENVNSSGVSLITMDVTGFTPQQGQEITFGSVTGFTWLTGQTVTIASATPITGQTNSTGDYYIVFIDPTGHTQYPAPNNQGIQTPVTCTGTITPSSSATGTGIATINYTVYSFITIESELAIAAAEVAVEYQTQFTSDVGVAYFPSNVELEATNLPQSSLAAGQYNPNGGNYLFATADFGQEVEITYKWTQQNTDSNAPSTLALTFFSGALGQAPWTYLQTTFPEFALGYSEVCYIASENMYLGYTNMLPQLSFEVAGQFQWGGGDVGAIPDANPADAIYGLLVNPSYKYNFPAAFIDNSLLVGNSSFRNSCAANDFFVSSLLDNPSSLMSVFGDWMEAAQCYNTWDEGRWKFIPLCDTSAVANGVTYTPNTQPIISLDDSDFVVEGKKDPITQTQSPWQSRWNRVAVRWSSRENDYNDDILQIEDEASINVSPGFLISEDAQDWQFIKTQAAAQYAANLRLQRYQAIYTTYKFTLKSNLAFLSPGDIIVLTDGLLKTQGYMFANQPVRITKMTDNPDAKGIEIEAETFPWSVGASLLNNQQSSLPSNTNDGPQEQPGDTSIIAIEIPDGAGLYVGDIVKLAVNGAQSSWGGCQIFVSDDGISYTFYQQVDTPARIGVTTADYPYSADDPDDTDSLLVNMTQSNSQLNSVSATTFSNFGTLSALISPGSNVSPKETAASGVNIGTTSNALFASQGPLTVTGAQNIAESVGPFTAGTAADGTGSTGNQPWTNFGNIGKNSSTLYVQSGTIPASGTNYKTTLPLKAEDFGFNLPLAYVPGGVTVTFNQGYTTSGIPVISMGAVTLETYSNNSQTRGWPGGLQTTSSPASGTAPARNSFPYSTTGVNSLVFNQVVPNYPINGFNNQPTNAGPGGGYKLNPMVAVNQTTSGIYEDSVTINGTTTNEDSGNFAGFVLDARTTLTVTTAGYYTFYVNYANVSSFAIYIGGGATFSSTNVNGGNGGNAFPSTGPVSGDPLAIVSTNMSATAHPYIVSSYIYFPSPGTYNLEAVYNQYLSTQFSYDNNGYFQITWLAGKANQSVGQQGPGVGTQFLPTPTNTTDGVWSVQLLKAGTAVGSVKTADATFGDTLALVPISFGSSTDLWGVSGGFSNTDVNASTFGVQIKFTDSTGTTNDTIAVNNVKIAVAGYTPAWANPDYIEGDIAYATTTVSTTASGSQPAEFSQELLGNYTGGGAFVLPASGIGPVTGVEVLFNAQPTGGSPNLIAQLLIGGNPSGATRTASITSFGSYSLGADTDLWGLSQITTAQINAENFGVRLTAEATGTPPQTQEVEVNQVQLQVFWSGGNNGSAWIDPQNVSDPVNYATSTLSPAPTTNTLWLFASDWGWQLPFGLEVSGFEVEVDAYSSTSGAVLTAQLVYEGLLYGVTKTVTLDTSVQTIQFGNSVDEWGIPQYGLTLDMVMDPSFGVAFMVSASTGSTEYIRNVRGTIYGGGGTFCELIAYQNAELTGNDTYTLTNVYRGLYGSYPIDSPAGSQFVRLDNNCVTYKVPPAYRGQNLFFKAISFNAYGNQLQSLADVAAIQVPILTASSAVGAIDSLTGQLTTGTANQSVFRIDPAVDAIHGGFGVTQIPFGYVFAQPLSGNQTPIWTPVSSGGGGGGGGGGGLAINYIIGLIDFGSDVGVIVRQFDVTATIPATWVTATSVVSAAPYGGLATATHGEQDGVIEGLVCQIENIVPGVGFDLHVYSPLGSWGQYAIAIQGQ